MTVRRQVSRSERQVRAPNPRSRRVFTPSEMASRLTCGFWPTSFRDLYTADGKKSLRFVSHREWHLLLGWSIHRPAWSNV
jgi:hypothetical protein